MTAPPFLDVLEELITTVVDPAAANVDATGTAAIVAPTTDGPQHVIGRALRGLPLFG